MDTKTRQLTKRERKFLKRQQNLESQEKEKYNRKVKKIINIVFVGLVIGGVFGGGWFLANKPSILESEIVAEWGIHWHSELSIKILGEYQEIPAGIGISSDFHQPMHTHDTTGRIHTEYPDLVREKDLKLSKFFEIWGKKFNKDCILDKCNGPEDQVKMSVNGQQNFEFENYIIKDGDKIEIVFETE